MTGILNILRLLVVQRQETVYKITLKNGKPVWWNKLRHIGYRRPCKKQEYRRLLEENNVTQINED